MSSDNRPEPEETAQRRDKALARLLKMPPKPHEDMKLGRPKRKLTPATADVESSGDHERKGQRPEIGARVQSTKT